jgi:mitogen-activated protein kinase kinase
MSSPVPLLRAPQPGGRSQSGSRTPKLTLGIPPSPSVKPVNHGEGPVELPRLNLTTHTGAPKLSLATPMGGYGHIQEAGHIFRPQIQPLNISTVQESSGRQRSDSFHNASVPGSASSSTYSQLSLALGGTGQKSGTPDPTSAISSVYSEAGIGGTSMESDGSMGGLSLDFEQMCIEKGRPLDVEDLDDDGWAAASDQKKIIELGSLGEGAGGAVTRCHLQDGKTTFALKVRSIENYVLHTVH